jgi:hypothetical protein
VSAQLHRAGTIPETPVVQEDAIDVNTEGYDVTKYGEGNAQVIDLLLADLLVVLDRASVTIEIHTLE